MEAIDSPSETLEIRWFSRAEIPVNRALICSDSLESRTDFYLLPAHRDCGIKYREQLLETKLRIGEKSALTTQLTAGKAAEWRKWSSPWGDSDAPKANIPDAVPAWIEVEKKRWLHSFGWVHGEMIGPVGATSAPIAYFEYGVVSIGANQWETVCVECTGGEVEQLTRLLSATIEHLEETGWIVGRLPGEDSKSYGEFLADLAHS